MILLKMLVENVKKVSILLKIKWVVFWIHQVQFLVLFMMKMKFVFYVNLLSILWMKNVLLYQQEIQLVIVKLMMLKRNAWNVKMDIYLKIMNVNQRILLTVWSMNLVLIVRFVIKVLVLKIKKVLRSVLPFKLFLIVKSIKLITHHSLVFVVKRIIT